VVVVVVVGMGVGEVNKYFSYINEINNDFLERLL